ncbi:glycerol kinase GlpK [Basilea psittacipulmonis]|uniref:glycerol kinase n=1 Tax=Basilea psittacipulmonis DSM 24701 TaxID=1072685 RepID=A0A077DEV4_9BURK|nr:glycerol kinase GlpK [Basilea psittacipulmonis]AIL31947.1 glycerol kinase [Basilea psittacipulmonis DSM 24701]
MYIMSLDQGTTSSRTLIFGSKGLLISIAQEEVGIQAPRNGYVEQNAHHLWLSQFDTMKKALEKANIPAYQISGIGITNQRETTILWRKDTGQAIGPALVWQDRRTHEWCRSLVEQGHLETIQSITGLKSDPYFSASKIRWMLDHYPDAKNLAASGKLAFGTVDSWLIWQLTKGQRHITDVTNASRTMLMDIETEQWSDTLLDLFDIPKSILPEIVPSAGELAYTHKDLFGVEIPIYAVLGDQQSALLGHGCEEPGTAKNTYGTGCFLLMNTGQKLQRSTHQLLSTITWKKDVNEASNYALEGSIFMAGAIVQWLRDGLGLFKASHEVEALAMEVSDSNGVVLVPAFTGLGAPYWDAQAQAAILGMTRGTHRAHIARAALEAIAYQVADVLNAMQKDTNVALTELCVDGGASKNDLLMQFQADILGVPVLRPVMSEMTAWGVAKLAGEVSGLFQSKEVKWTLDRAFEPSLSEDERCTKLALWHQAVNKVLSRNPSL